MTKQGSKLISLRVAWARDAPGVLWWHRSVASTDESFPVYERTKMNHGEVDHKSLSTSAPKIKRPRHISVWLMVASSGATTKICAKAQATLCRSWSAAWQLRRNAELWKNHGKIMGKYGIFRMNGGL